MNGCELETPTLHGPIVFGKALPSKTARKESQSLTSGANKAR
jgi:hypothetical protein